MSSNPDLAAPISDIPPIVWGVPEIGRHIGRNKRQVHHLMKNGLLRTGRIGRRRVATAAAIRAFLKEAEPE